MGAQTVERQSALERPVEIAVAIIALLGLPKMATGVTFQETPTMLFGLAVLAAAHLVIAIDCLWIKRLGWVVFGLTAVGTACIVLGQLSSPDIALWRTDAWFGSVFTYAILLLRNRVLLAALAAVFVAGQVTLALTKDLGWVPQLLGVIFTGSGIAVLCVARMVTIVIAEEYLSSRLQRAEQAVEAGEAAARAEAMAGLRREMHDSLLHTLQRMGASWSVAEPAEIRAACKEAAQRLATVPRASDEHARLDVCEEVREALAPGRQVITSEPEAIFVPRSVAEAFEGAAREAVRNALKYAPGVPEVRITLRGESVRVAVIDDGPGFDVASQQGQSLGLEGSVVQRMAAVGGEARVLSGGEGTTVDMRWPASAPPAGGLGAGARRLVSWLPLPLLLATFIQVLAMGWPAMAAPMAAALGIAVFILIGALRVRRGGLPAWQAATLCLAGMAAFVYNYTSLRGVESTDWDLWAPTLVSAVLVIALAGQPVKVAVPLAVLVVVGAVSVSGLTLGWQATLQSHFGGILAVVLYAVVTLVLVFGATGVSRHLHVTRKLAAAATLHAQAGRVRDVVWVEWLARARELTGDFLDDVVEGRRDPQDPETRAMAARLGARIRDELRLWPGPLDLATELDRLRGLGWDARLLDPEIGATPRADLVQLLRAVDARGEDGAQLQVVSEPSGSVVTFTPRIDLVQHPQLRQWVSLDDPEFTQLRTPERGRDD
ncbi:MAG: hypothetical protein Q4G35_08930 [Propionibacteriaceae bacterium]|nr:hypothetical protein [Propionibacteriaceae bacterium]